MSSEDWVAVCLVPLAVWILLSGFDDLFIGMVKVLRRREPFPWPSDGDLELPAERRMAILLPLWHEHAVVGRMLEDNLASIRYRQYDIFAGVYPNDALTLRAVREAASRHPRVHVAECPHPGPTSKGDCLNWIYRALETYEARHRVRFDVVITHDAEDLIHPKALKLINWLSGAYQMVQIPVLPLPTGLRELTHGLYCDEFAEYQSKDIPVRGQLHGFIPSNGVGTGYTREALDRLAGTRHGQVFDPECLTEDYENGFCLHELGYRQIFVPVRFDSAGPVATREYFPRKLRAAIRQRSRWVAGITLQGWERHGWRVHPIQVYWFWRDRKGLVSNLLSPVTNLLLPVAIWFGLTPGHSHSMQRWLAVACAINLGISAVQAGFRIRYSARIYGWRFAAGVPLRILWGNLVNCLATFEAVRQYAVGRVRGRSLAWRKTEHVYPVNGAASRTQRPRLGEVLVEMRCLSMPDLNRVLRECPPGVRLGEHLLELEKLSEDELYRALSSQAGMPLGLPQSGPSLAATRALPAEAVRRWKVMPYRISVGQLLVVTPEIPSEQLARQLKRISNLDIRFRLVRQSEFDALAERYLPPPA